ncbi:CYFA0S01e13014g1_1 [Cyberlindnera fabianii]|uniref:3-hydroxyisobutyryl-CoA hydrolase n=1 Tax=Cyberlindnera fabianii TaxID=36022 RepID=A0A061AJ83_CYBFA|nr:CYFA0S01e13014g1_1 [Cyberlindnera fabianii]
MASSSASAAAPTIEEDDVLFANINAAKVITLNRPKKLNSLNYSMLEKLYPRLQEYVKSDVTDVIIQKSNGRAFCAGGDVTSCVEANLKGQWQDSITFFQKEYSLNYLYATYPKPIVSLMDGITMGGGVGLSVHTPFRIATENTRWAMPEMDIGFSPDVGATFALNKIVSPSFGWYLALTGESIFGADAYFAGIATHYVPSFRLPELIKAISGASLKNGDAFQIINNVISEFTEPLPANYEFKYSPQQLQLLEKVFHPTSTVESIFEALEADGSEFASKTLATLKTKSPISLKVALKLLQRGSVSSIHEALTNELHAAKKFMQDSDFNEGVSSKLIRKSKDVPNWKYKTPAEVAVKELIPFFKPDPALQLDKLFGVTFTDYPHNFGLPKESELKAFIHGEDGKNAPGTVTRSDVIDHFSNLEQYKHKSGLKKYLNHFLNSRGSQVKL